MTRIVSVHGFWADGSSWAQVIPRLEAAGHDVLAVQLPLSSQDDDVATVHRALDRGHGPAVLAGHSYGGVVITRAGAHPDVQALAYLSAYAPDTAEDVGALAEQYPTAGGAAIRPSADGHLWLDVDGFADAFAADVDPALARVMARTQGPAAFACLSPIPDAPAWRMRPSTFLVSTEDRVIHPDLQRSMAARAGASVTEVPASHAALISRPDAAAAVVLGAVEHAASDYAAT